MIACAYCLNKWKAERCQFSGSDWCRYEQRLEDLAHAINASRSAVEQQP